MQQLCGVSAKSEGVEKYRRFYHAACAAIGTLATSKRGQFMRQRTHPDSHELHDWPVYGPKDPEIAKLVELLAYEHGLRVREIEDVIIQALTTRFSEEANTPR